MIRRRLVPLLLCLSLLLAFVPASGGTSLSISLPETVRGFTPGTITLTAPFAGEAVLRLYDRLHLDCLLAAPTGRAAKRMTELTGREAYTVHRLLGAAWSGEEDELTFRRNESDPLHCGAVILDE